MSRVNRTGVNLSQTVPGKEQMLHQAVFFLAVSSPTVLCIKSQLCHKWHRSISLPSHSHLILQTRMTTSLVFGVVIVVVCWLVDFFFETSFPCVIVFITSLLFLLLLLIKQFILGQGSRYFPLFCYALGTVLDPRKKWRSGSETNAQGLATKGAV